MIINNIGYNHCHDSDFYIDRQNGSGDNLLLLVKNETIFFFFLEDYDVPENSFFMYQKGRPPYYLCVP